MWTSLAYFSVRGSQEIELSTRALFHTLYFHPTFTSHLKYSMLITWADEDAIERKNPELRYSITLRTLAKNRNSRAA